MNERKYIMLLEFVCIILVVIILAMWIMSYIKDHAKIDIYCQKMVFGDIMIKTDMTARGRLRIYSKKTGDKYAEILGTDNREWLKKYRFYGGRVEPIYQEFKEEK